jgi:hypothetical protein
VLQEVAKGRARLVALSRLTKNLSHAIELFWAKFKIAQVRISMFNAVIRPAPRLQVALARPGS